MTKKVVKKTVADPAPKKVAAKKAPKAAPTADNGQDWAKAEKNLINAIKRRSEDGHYYNTVVVPLKEQFEAGGLNPNLYEALINL